MDRRQLSGFDSNPIQTSSSKIISKYNFAFRDADLKDFHRQFLDKAPYNAIIISKDFDRLKKFEKLHFYCKFQNFYNPLDQSGHKRCRHSLDTGGQPSPANK